MEYPKKIFRWCIMALTAVMVVYSAVVLSLDMLLGYRLLEAMVR